MNRTKMATLALVGLGTKQTLEARYDIPQILQAVRLFWDPQGKRPGSEADDISDHGGPLCSRSGRHL